MDGALKELNALAREPKKPNNITPTLKEMGALAGAIGSGAAAGAAKGALRGAASGNGILSTPFKAAQTGIGLAQKAKYNYQRRMAQQLKANKPKRFKMKKNNAVQKPKLNLPTDEMAKHTYLDSKNNVVYGINKIPTNARPTQGPLPIYRRKAALPVK